MLFNNMPYYACPKCGKINFLESSGETIVIETCKNCGYIGELKLIILKQDQRNQEL